MHIFTFEASNIVCVETVHIHRSTWLIKRVLTCPNTFYSMLRGDTQVYVIFYNYFITMDAQNWLSVEDKEEISHKIPLTIQKSNHVWLIDFELNAHNDRVFIVGSI